MVHAKIIFYLLQDGCVYMLLHELGFPVKDNRGSIC